MNVRAALAFNKMSFQEIVFFRAFFILTILANVIFTIIVYFLWRAIFDGVGTDTINGMTFQQTFLYLASAKILNSVIISYAEWQMSRDVQTGNIATNFCRPISYQFRMYSSCFGSILSNFAIMFIPSIIIVSIMAKGSIPLGINLLFFPIAFILAALLNTTFDFLIGLLSFFTESVWGISAMKDTVVRLLSGAVIPIAFFPDNIRKVLEFLPFQAIYNLPIQILTNPNYSLWDICRALLIQLIWVIVLFLISKICFIKASKHVMVNGG